MGQLFRTGACAVSFVTHKLLFGHTELHQLFKRVTYIDQLKEITCLRCPSNKTDAVLHSMTLGIEFLVIMQHPFPCYAGEGEVYWGLLYLQHESVDLHVWHPFINSMWHFLRHCRCLKNTSHWNKMMPHVGVHALVVWILKSLLEKVLKTRRVMSVSRACWSIMKRFGRPIANETGHLRSHWTFEVYSQGCETDKLLIC